MEYGMVETLLGSPFIAWHAWKLVCHPIPNLSAHRRRFQRRRFNKYLNRGLQCGAEDRLATEDQASPFTCMRS